MVFEFTELQGVIGKKYALNAGEPAAVADAIEEHYLPRFAGDAVATSKAGIAVSLADKLDTIMAVFSHKNAKLPSGSKDPLGLRRLASGLIQTILENQLRYDLDQGLRQAYRNLGALADETEEAALEKVTEFILQRFRAWLLEQNIRYDIIDAVLQGGLAPALSDLQDVLLRIEHLKGLVQNESRLAAVHGPGNRIARILGERFDPGVSPDAVQPALFQDETEGKLHQAVAQVAAGVSLEQPDYDKLIPALAELSSPIEAFFDKVLINDPDPKVRENRYNQLSILYRYYIKLANFPKLVV